MKQSDLKSGITSKWLERAKSVSAATIGHEVWLDTEGYWHEKMKDGTEVKYGKDEAYTQMRTGMKDDMNAPEYMRIDGMWLKIHGLWVAPMALLGYTSSSTSTSHPVYSEKLTHEDDPSIPEGKHVTYTETLLVTHDKRTAVHVVYNMFNTEEGTRYEPGCKPAEFVYL